MLIFVIVSIALVYLASTRVLPFDLVYIGYVGLSSLVTVAVGTSIFLRFGMHSVVLSRLA